jgi:CUB/sushi domain-containing protein
VVDLCESPPEFITPTDDVMVDWDEPLFHDNSREPLSINQSHTFGRFPFGTTLVTYTAVDPSGNAAFCSINITLQSKRRRESLFFSCKEHFAVVQTKRVV